MAGTVPTGSLTGGGSAGGGGYIGTLSGNVPSQYAPFILKWAKVYGLDPAVVAAMIEVESSWDPSCGANKQYKGLMQIGSGSNSALAQRIAASYSWMDPDQNIQGG